MNEEGTREELGRVRPALQTVTFTLPRRDVWKRDWRGWLRLPLRLLLRLAMLAYCVFFVCRQLRLDAALTATISGMAWTLVGIVFLLTARDVARKAAAAFADAAQPQVAELGAFDFRLGRAARPGPYHHWTEFQDIADGPNDLLFVLRGRPALCVPKSAFDTPAAAQAFLAEARALWGAARLRQAVQIEHTQEADPSVETVWPPPPRRAIIENSH